MNVTSWLRKELDFVPNWKRAAFTGLGLGLVLSLLMILLQPFDTYQYQSPYKNLELLGYTPCIMLSMLLMVPLENWFFHRQGQRWQIWNEILVILLGGVVMMTASHIYNVLTISGGVPSLRSWWLFIKGFGLPFFIFLAPMWAVVRQKLWRMFLASLYRTAAQSSERQGASRRYSRANEPTASALSLTISRIKRDFTE